MRKYGKGITILILINIGIICAYANTQGSQTETLKGREEISLEYSKECAKTIEDLLGCTEKKADSILRKLAKIQITDVKKAKLESSKEEYRMEIHDGTGTVYQAYIDKTFHLFAVKATDSGNYIYAEYQ